MTHWWASIPPAEVTVPCGGDTHTVRWEAGELIAVDHRGPKGEVTARLAGESVPCLELLRTWSRRADDPHVLTLASRGPTDPLNINLDGLRFDYGAPRHQTEEQTLRLLAAGGRLPDRLQVTTAAIWTRRLRTGHAQLETARPQLEAALYGRVLRTLRAWLGEPQLTVELTMIGPEEQRGIVRTADGVEVSLPFSWLSDVWMRGLAVTFGRLCIAADTTDGSKLDPGHTRPGPHRSQAVHDRYPVAQTTHAREGVTAEDAGVMRGQRSIDRRNRPVQRKGPLTNG